MEAEKLKTEYFKRFLEAKENEKLKIRMKNALQAFSNGSDYMFLRCLKATAVDARTNVTFRNATCKVEAMGSETRERKYMAPIGSFFLTGYKILQDFLIDKPKKPKVPADELQLRALQQLLQFLSSDNALLVKNAERECETVTARRYAEHLLMPLVNGKTYVIDTCPGVQSVQCCDVEHPLSGMCGDTSFGLRDGWHGTVDIIIKNTTEEELPIVIEKSHEDDLSVTSVEIKSDEIFFDNTYSQLIAETFVFSFLQSKQFSSKLHNFLIPSVGINNDKLIVFMYDCEHDVLLGTHELDLMDEEDFDVRVIIFLWLVLNYRLFCTGLIDEFNSYQAEFHTLLGYDCLQRYRNDVTMPYHDTRGQKRLFDPSKSNVAPLLEKKLKFDSLPEILQLEIITDAS